MLEIKIRSYNNNDKRFYYFLNGGYFTVKGEIADRWKFNWENAEQFTGLYDKNGKEIYEGDIIQGDLFDCRLPTMGTIIYDEFLSGYANKNYGGHTLLFNINNKEIIGNIHENPELLDF